MWRFEQRKVTFFAARLAVTIFCNNFQGKELFPKSAMCIGNTRLFILAPQNGAHIITPYRLCITQSNPTHTNPTYNKAVLPTSVMPFFPH